jgi:hypothetical protein
VCPAIQEEEEACWHDAGDALRKAVDLEAGWHAACDALICESVAGWCVRQYRKEEEACRHDACDALRRESVMGWCGRHCRKEEAQRRGGGVRCASVPLERKRVLAVADAYERRQSFGYGEGSDCSLLTTRFVAPSLKR